MKKSSAHVPLITERRLSSRLLAGITKAWLQVQRWWELAEQRRKLAMLDEHALHDLGLSRADAINESERPFWDDPLARPQPDEQASSSAGSTTAAGRLLS